MHRSEDAIHGLVNTLATGPCSRARVKALYNVKEPDRDRADSEIDVRIDSNEPSTSGANPQFISR